MTRCVEFYDYWRNHPNFCNKDRVTIRNIDSYVKLLDAAMERGVDESVTNVTVSENAARPLFSVKDPTVYDQVVGIIVEHAEAGRKVSAGDIKAWIDLAAQETGSEEEPCTSCSGGSRLAGWHPSVNNCQGCVLLGYEKAPKSRKLTYICTAAKSDEGFYHGRPPYGMEKCPLGTGPVKVGCRFFGEDTFCKNPHGLECTAATRNKYHCPLTPGSYEVSPALELMRRQAGRNPQSGAITVEYCRLKGCPDLQPRQKLNDADDSTVRYECVRSGLLPGSLQCPEPKEEPVEEISPDKSDTAIPDEPTGEVPEPEYLEQYPVTAACLALECTHLKETSSRRIGKLHVCELSGQRPENMVGELPDGCPKKKIRAPDEEPVIDKYLEKQFGQCQKKACPEIVWTPEEIYCKVMKDRDWKRYDCPIRPKVPEVKPGTLKHAPPQAATGVGEAAAIIAAHQSENTEPSEERESGAIRRAINLLTDKPDVEEYTVKAGRHEQVTIRNMIKYGDALDEQAAVQMMFKDGAALWLDKMERRVQEETDQAMAGDEE
ncbi:MAG: hypothetical protein PHH09_03995 [Methanoregulaceae archaeon]|nr:hypothetical protein [Methanoregulaceae archaeon]